MPTSDLAVGRLLKDIKALFVVGCIIAFAEQKMGCMYISQIYMLF